MFSRTVTQKKNSKGGSKFKNRGESSELDAKKSELQELQALVAYDSHLVADQRYLPRALLRKRIGHSTKHPYPFPFDFKILGFDFTIEFILKSWIEHEPIRVNLASFSNNHLSWVQVSETSSGGKSKARKAISKQFRNDGLGFSCDSTYYSFEPIVLQPSGFVHLTWTFSSGVMKVYINGILSGLTRVPHLIKHLSFSSADVGSSFLGSDQFQGRIDRVATFHGELPEVVIMEHYAAAFHNLHKLQGQNLDEEGKMILSGTSVPTLPNSFYSSPSLPPSTPDQKLNQEAVDLPKGDTESKSERQKDSEQETSNAGETNGFQARKEDIQTTLKGVKADIAALELILQRNVQAMDLLNMNDIRELRNVRKPVKAVSLTFEVIFILLNIHVTENELWKSVQKILIDPQKFLDSLKHLDKDNIDIKTIERLGPYMENQDFSVETIRASSSACASLCKFAHAVYIYCQIAGQLKAKKSTLAETEEHLRSTIEQQAKATLNLFDPPDPRIVFKSVLKDIKRRRNENSGAKVAVAAATREAEASSLSSSIFGSSNGNDF